MQLRENLILHTIRRVFMSHIKGGHTVSRILT